MSRIVTPTIDPFASQVARLLRGSDVDELREIVRRWIAEAPAGGARRTYEAFGHKLLELKEALASERVQPTEEELATMLTMMLRLAAESGGKPTP